ncbi:MAG: FAD-dependent oxidoreductase [Candidatus Daviesbacteria bacterium]|nr:FAD-dependent oxidoreductase [Candidatus Daviesbacteria bacterium]
MLLKISTVKEEVPGVFSLIFDKPAYFHSYPGQYLDYELPVKDPDGNTRSFTISSSPTENFLMLSTRHGITPFKKLLETLKPGVEIKTSHPAGTFTLDEKSPAVMIAGGIGITPFRSMIKWAYDNHLNIHIKLIYANSDADFPFKNELDKWKKELKNLKIDYINTTIQGKLDARKLKFLTTNYSLPSTVYYLAGPPKMVTSFEKTLLSEGVDKTNIRYDEFDGY